MIRIYRYILVGLMAAAIGFGVWYCVYTYEDQKTIKNGTLVYHTEYGTKGVWKDVSNCSIY